MPIRIADLIAGLSVAGLLLPEAVAYAGIAGLPPQHAIFAAVAGCLTYGLAGRSRFAVVAPTSSAAAILAAALANLPLDPAERADATVIMVAVVGVLFVLASAARLGGLTGFISRPVLRGFAFGLALTIILRQLPLLAGLDIHEPDLFRLAATLVRRAGEAHGPSLAIGVAALALLLALRRWPQAPAAFGVLVLGIAVSRAMDLPQRGVAVVGALDIVPAIPVWPQLSEVALSHLVQLTLPLVLILFAESWGTMRSHALRHGDSVDPDRELAALGWANLASALLRGMPVGAGFSASSANEAAGAASRLAGIIAGGGLLALVAAGSSLVSWLPEPVLGAIVVAAVSHSLDPGPLVRLWRLDRDKVVAIVAAVGVVAAGVVNGMLLAIGLSLVVLVRRLASPVIVQLGRLGDSHDFVDVSRHADARPVDGLAIWRPAEPLFFANAERILAAVEREVVAAPGVRVVILSLEESFDLDSTALDSLLEFDARLAARGLPLTLARTRDPIRDLLARAEAGDLLERIAYSVDDAVARTRTVEGRQPVSAGAVADPSLSG